MSKRLAQRVLLIGWDAADWKTIKPLLETNQLPHLRTFIDEGVMGNVATLQPVISPILWNSIATGKYADKHGILGFIEPDSAGGIRPVTSTSRNAKALWNILSQLGLRSAVVGWYASHPAEPINGVVVTDRYQRTGGKRADKFPLDEKSVHPPELLDALRDLRLNLNDITPAQILPFIPQAQRIDQTSDVRLAALCHLIAECATLHNAATYVVENEEWDFAAVYYDAIDHFNHGFMEYHPPKMEHISDEEFEIYQHVVRGCYRFHDMMLGRLLELAGPETTVILLSDHGFFDDELRPKLYRDPQNPAKKLGPGVNPVAWHRRYGVLALHGPGIKQDELVHGASLIDIAPTILALLGVPIPRDMDGQPLTRTFSEQPELDYVDTYEGEHPQDGMVREAQDDDPDSAAAVLERLADLGYIDDPTAEQDDIVEKAIADRQHNLAQVYLSTGRVQEAHGTLVGLLGKGENPHLRSRIAMCLMQMGRLEEAEEMVRLVVEQPGSHLLADMLYGELLMARKEYDQALTVLKRVQEANPRLAHLHTNLGRVHLHQKHWRLAEEAFRRALDIDGEAAEAHDLLGVVLYEQGKFEDALFHHMRSAALEHYRPQTHMNLGTAAARLGQADWAIQAFKVAIEQAPDNPYPHRMLAQIYGRQKGEREKAQYHADRARELRAAAGLEGEPKWSR